MKDLVSIKVPSIPVDIFKMGRSEIVLSCTGASFLQLIVLEKRIKVIKSEGNSLSSAVGTIYDSRSGIILILIFLIFSGLFY